MEDIEGNKERNVVKVLAKRPSQSTETEVCKNQSFTSLDFDISWNNILRNSKSLTFV